MLKIPIPVLSCLFLMTATSTSVLLASTQVIIDENFSDISEWTDMSLVPSWGDDGSGQPFPGHSAFEIVNRTDAGSDVVQLVRTGTNSTLSFSSPYTANGLKSFMNLDQRFTTPIPHGTNRLTIEIRLKWESLESAGRPGENGRFFIILNHDYPDGPDNGLFLTPEGTPGSKLADFTEENWWARPAYHLRIRGGSDGNGSALLNWGGGFSNEGEYEQLHASENRDWWLPGFISGSYIDAGTPNSPGIGGPQWPLRSWKHTTIDWTFDTNPETGTEPNPGQRISLARDDRFYSVRWVLSPDKQEVYADFNDNGTFIKHAEMKLPLATPLHPNYRYFNDLEGVRLFWYGRDRGSQSGDQGQVYVDHLTVTAEALTPPSIPALAVAQTGPTQVDVTFPTLPGQNYQAWTSGDLSPDNWAPSGDQVTGDGQPRTVQLDLTAGNPEFIRVETQLVTD